MRLWLETDLNENGYGCGSPVLLSPGSMVFDRREGVPPSGYVTLQSNRIVANGVGDPTVPWYWSCVFLAFCPRVREVVDGVNYIYDTVLPSLWFTLLTDPVYMVLFCSGLMDCLLLASGPTLLGLCALEDL